jgi:isopentenyl diphosphate isomerase/L-lactate dehydrogenase-like FMN-dependent dehydrogenase
MAAKNNPKRPRAPFEDRDAPDIQEIFSLYLQGAQRRDQIIEEIQQPGAAANMKAAQELMRPSRSNPGVPHPRWSLKYVREPRIAKDDGHLL